MSLRRLPITGFFEFKLSGALMLPRSTACQRQTALFTEIHSLADLINVQVFGFDRSSHLKRPAKSLYQRFCAILGCLLLPFGFEKTCCCAFLN